MQNIISKVLLPGLFLIVSQSLFSQQFNIQSPIDFPILLSGNFGELRSTHFHAGIDIKTQGETGKKIYAVEQGYVSRAKIQAGGYGHALYITHPNGYTSVYGHLQNFFPELEEWINDLQYKKKSFEVDQYFEKDRFPVNKGQVIAISGNTGRSGGPHLHFEIRDKNQVPMNGLLFGLPIVDSIPPLIKKLVVYNGANIEEIYNSEKEAIDLRGVSGEYSIKDPIHAVGNVAFGVEVYDYLNGTTNRCGVFSLELFVNDVKVYSAQIDKISFSQTRYIKSYCDYAAKKTQGASVHKLFVEPNNHLGVYSPQFSNGIVSLSDTSLKSCKIVASDAYGNTSTLLFNVKQKDIGLAKPLYNECRFLSCKKGHVIEEGGAIFKIPEGALYSGVYMDFQKTRSDSTIYQSSFFRFGNQLVPMHKYPELSIKIDVDNNLTVGKLVVARFDTSGKVISEGGRYKDGWITAKVEGFGKYALVADTVGPVIKRISFKDNSWYAAGDKLSFKISDDLSGIKTYNGYIDDKWVLFEYDEKSDNLIFRIDPSRVEKTRDLHALKLYIMDERNNISSFHGKFYY